MVNRDEIKANEHIYPGRPSVKYYMTNSSNPNCNYLLVGFSGFNGNEKNGEPARYNYIKYLKSIDLNQIYILDSNENNIPLYYLGEGTTEYQDKVIQLILDIANQKNIPLSNIVTFGSSKGGTAAAYFAMKYSLGNFISGGMQTKVGDYLFSLGGYSRDKIIPTISDNTPEQGRDKINRIFMNIFDNPIQNTNYYLHGGKEDSHFVNYVKPFVDNLTKKNIKYDLDIANYKDHGEIGLYFSKYLCSTVSNIVKIPVIEKISQEVKDTILYYDIQLYSDNIKPVYAIYIFKENDSIPIKKIPYQKEPNFEIPKLAKGKYRARVYCKFNDYVTKVNTGYITL